MSTSGCERAHPLGDERHHLGVMLDVQIARQRRDASHHYI